MSFEEELRGLINRHSRENGSNTPDFILSNFMAHCLEAFEVATHQRETWYGVKHRPGQSAPPGPASVI